MRILMLLLGGCLLVSDCMISAQAMPQALDCIVAIVNDHVITANQLAAEMQLARQTLQANHQPISKRFPQTVLDHLIATELQLQLAKNAGLVVSEAAVDQAILTIASNNGWSLAELQTQVHRQGIAYPQYRERIRQSMLVDQLQRQMIAPITVTQGEIKAFLAHVSTPDTMATYHLEDLLIPVDAAAPATEILTTQQRARGLLQQARQGKGLRQLAMQANLDHLVISDLGWRCVDELPTVFVEAIKNLAVGTVTGPIRADNGWHLLYLIARRDGINPPTPVYVTHARHILLKTSPLVNDAQAKQRLLNIRAAILRGEDFAGLAERYSQDPPSAVKGGDLGWVPQGMLEPLFEEQLAKISPNLVSQPFKTSAGWHIVQVLARKTVTLTGQALAERQAATVLYQRKLAASLQQRLRQLRDQAYIKINPTCAQSVH